MIDIGVVVATYPEGNSVDVLMDDGGRLSNVQVMVPTGSSDTGILDLPHVEGVGDMSRWNFDKNRNRYLRAVIASCRGVPVVIGFLLPQVNQCTFSEKNRRVDRHASDFYTTVDDAGNFEASHPSGTYVRIGTAAEHEDLSGKDFDGKWAISRNTDKAVNLQVTVKNAGAQKASINIDPSGNITINHTGNLSINTGGNLSATVTGNLAATIGGTTSLNSTGNVTITAPLTTVAGPMTVQGLFTFLAGMAGSGGAGGVSATITGNMAINSGNLTVTSGNVAADGVGLKTHHHTGVQTGGGNTGGPVG